ncbi:hypothetical protein C8R43DRAFT_1133310 [Mycena crocata]|nr:hypothetical protein C8R43DRAFT_1133310 [Mycena crocata]
MLPRCPSALRTRRRFKPTDPATAAQRLRRLKSSRDYNAEWCAYSAPVTSFNTIGQKPRRAQLQEEAPYGPSARLPAAGRSRADRGPGAPPPATQHAGNHREKNRDTLAQKSQERRNELKIAKRRAEAKERRQRELAARRSVQGLPLAVPSSYSARERAVAIADHRRQQEEYVRMAEEGDSDDGEEGDSN